MDALINYIIEDMAEVTEYFDDPSEQAKQICIILSVFEGIIPETFFRLYTDTLDIDKEILYNAVAYFTGMGKMWVVCDCEQDAMLCDMLPSAQGPFYELGQMAACTQSDAWVFLGDLILAMKTGIDNV